MRVPCKVCHEEPCTCFRVIIAGSRNIYSPETAVAFAVRESGWTGLISEVVSGTARGIDRAGEQWAEAHNIPVNRFPAEWDLYGKRAGYIRNEEMAQYSHALIAIWDGKSRGTKHMIDIATKKGLKVHVYNTRED